MTDSDTQPKFNLDMPAKLTDCGWYVSAGNDCYLRKDLTVQKTTGYMTPNSGFWSTEYEALTARAKYLKKSKCPPQIKAGSHWERVISNIPSSIGEIIQITKINDNYIEWGRNRGLHYKPFLERFKPRPDLDDTVSEQSENNTNQQTETQMKKLDLILLFQFLATQAAEKVDATNAKHIGILVGSEGSYVGYVYANTIKELQDIVRKPENEGRKLHIFDYSQTLAQKPRPVTKVARV